MAENELPRKLATIVAVDVAGFSALTEADESKTTAAVAALGSVIAAIAARHGGRVFNTAGDGFMLEFMSSVAAVEASFELTEKCEPKVRVGVHLGDVVVQPNGDLLGHGVNVAARLMAKSDPGCALISAAVRQTLRGPVADRLVPFGTFRLDKMSETIEAFATSAEQSNRARERELIDARLRARRLLQIVLVLGGLSIAVIVGAGMALWFAGAAQRNGELADARLAQMMSLYRSSVEEALALQYNAPSRVVVSLLSGAKGKFESLIEKERQANANLPVQTLSQFIDLQLRFSELMATEKDRLDEAAHSVDIAWTLLDELGRSEDGRVVALFRADAYLRRAVVAHRKGLLADAKAHMSNATGEVAKARWENSPLAFAIKFREVSAAALTEHAKLARNTTGNFDGEVAWRDAAKSLSEALALREVIAKADPERELADREIARAHERLGDLNADFGAWDPVKFPRGSSVVKEHLGLARDSYDRSLAILELAKDHAPNNAGIRYDLVAGLQRKGATLGLLGQGGEVAKVYASALAELEDIAETDPDSHVWLQARAAVKFNWGKFAFDRGDVQGAVSHLLDAKNEYDRIARYATAEDWMLEQRLQTYYLLGAGYKALRNVRLAGEILASCREQVLRLRKPRQARNASLCR